MSMQPPVPGSSDPAGAPRYPAHEPGMAQNLPTDQQNMPTSRTPQVPHYDDAAQVPPAPQRVTPSPQERVDHVSDPRLDEPVKRGMSGALWAGLILGVIVLILLLVFIIQNNVTAQFEYMAWTFQLPLGIAILLAAIAGALIMAMVGSVRMFSLSHRVRKLEKERRRIKDTLTD